MNIEVSVFFDLKGQSIANAGYKASAIQSRTRREAGEIGRVSNGRFLCDGYRAELFPGFIWLIPFGQSNLHFILTQEVFPAVYKFCCITGLTIHDDD